MLVRRWRERRRRSQFDVSLAAELSTRHLSRIETGRANPSRDMIRRLCDELDVPLRERDALYLTAAFAPVHPDGLSPELHCPARARASPALLYGPLRCESRAGTGLIVIRFRFRVRRCLLCSRRRAGSSGVRSRSSARGRPGRGRGWRR
ncbi:helix-turn-helix transcriptional regulator, partial [Streptomyces sp. DH10]